MNTIEANEKQRAARVWGASPAGSAHAIEERAGTREFFEQVREARKCKELATVLELIPFEETRGKRILEVGCGAGFDAYEFCRCGAWYTGVDITPENPPRVLQHLRYYGYRPDVRVADAESLPFVAEEFDVVFSNGVLHHTPNMPQALAEIHRVLRPGGTLWMIVYHKHSIFYWVSLWLVEHILKLGFLQRSFAERLAMIEYTTSDALPLVRAYSRGEVKRLLADQGFSVRQLCVRKLLREDLPSFPGARLLFGWIPQSWLDALGRLWGWYVIAEAVNP